MPVDFWIRNNRKWKSNTILFPDDNVIGRVIRTEKKWQINSVLLGKKKTKKKIEVINFKDLDKIRIKCQKQCITL